MKLRYALFVGVLPLAGSLSAQDSCTDALAITAGTYTVDTINGTEIPLPVCSSGGTGATAGEWYLYTAPGDLTVTVSSDLAQNGNTDTRVQVLVGTCGSLTCLVGDDDSGAGLLSIAVFNALAGQSFYIGWDNRYSSAGFDFVVSEQPWDPSQIAFVSQTVATSGSAYAAVDMNNDGYDDVVSVTQTNIRIHHQQPDGSLVMTDYPTTSADYTPSWSMAAGDIDGNGFLDLLYGGGSGVTFMYSNAAGTAFAEVSGPQYVFSQRSNFVDINSDGNLDAFVCHDVQPTVYYINDGTGNLTFQQGGLGDTPDGGNYGSIWIDYNNDHLIDLFIAKCRGGQQVPASVDQLHRNNGDGTFTDVAAEMNLADYQQSWSGAWGDYDMDGDMDVMIGASSMTQGGHKLMRNDGTTFTDVTIGSGFDVFTGTTIEWVAHDFDNDGWIDILGAGSVIHFNNGDMTFTPMTVNASSGPIADLNNDGFLDVVNGGTIRINTGNNNHWLRVNLHGTLSNANGIGARVEITSALGTQIRDVKSGDGFRYMSFLGAHFGLGQDELVDQIIVYWPSGVVDVMENVAVDGAIDITESLPTALSPAPSDLYTFGPNPTNGQLILGGPGMCKRATALVIDATGKTVHRQVVEGAVLDVSALSAGSYILQIVGEAGLWQQRFTRL